MDSNLAAIAASWSFAPWLALWLALSAAVYTRGWVRLRRRRVRHFGASQLVCFLGGLAAIYLALMSPLDAMAPLLMQAHMVQHLLLMFVAPPLILLASPEVPMIAGLPEYMRRTWVVPLWQLPTLRSFAGWLTRPVTAWTISVGVLWFWHVPAMYEWTLRDRVVHDIEHLSFMASSLLFWWPVVAPYPRRRAATDWALLPYLFLAGLQASVLSGILTFSEHVLYPHYEKAPRLWGMSALTDQAIGGAIMWTIGSLALLIPLAAIGRKLLTSDCAYTGPCPSLMPLAPPVQAGADVEVEAYPLQQSTGGASGTIEGARAVTGQYRQLPIISDARVPTRKFDLLRVPWLGAVLRSPRTRVVLQFVLFGAAAILVIDGLFGPQVSPINLAGVAPWNHWRWLVVVGLLATGNFFCFACPFTLPRRLAARWLPAAWTWPRWLTGKLPAIALLVLFFWAYELFALWNSPWWTAWLVIGYFALALIIDGLFRGTPFCRYVCPIGQFNFVYSLVSPLEVSVRDSTTCTTCKSHACLRGSETVAGCDTGLFQPQKQGNMDCTFCLDCVRSCPHDNVGVLVGLPAARISQSERTDGGRPSTRLSVIALIVVLTAAAFISAFWMTAPRSSLERQLVSWSVPMATPILITAGTLLGLVFAPLGIVMTVAACSRRAAGESEVWRSNAARFVFCLVPLGLGMWAAHYTYHFLTAAGTIVTAAWRLAADLGLSAAANWSWACPCCGGQLTGWLIPSQFLALDVGLIGSLYVAYAIARGRHGRSWQAAAAMAPWGALVVALFGIGCVILLEPMEMRGTLGALAGGKP